MKGCRFSPRFADPVVHDKTHGAVLDIGTLEQAGGENAP